MADIQSECETEVYAYGPVKQQILSLSEGSFWKHDLVDQSVLVLSLFSEYVSGWVQLASIEEWPHLLILGVISATCS